MGPIHRSTICGVQVENFDGCTDYIGESSQISVKPCDDAPSIAATNSLDHLLANTDFKECFYYMDVTKFAAFMSSEAVIGQTPNNMKFGKANGKYDYLLMKNGQIRIWHQKGPKDIPENFPSDEFENPTFGHGSMLNRNEWLNANNFMKDPQKCGFWIENSAQAPISPVVYGGEIWVDEDGKVSRINNGCGSFHPPSNKLDEVATLLGLGRTSVKKRCVQINAARRKRGRRRRRRRRCIS